MGGVAGLMGLVSLDNSGIDQQDSPRSRAVLACIK